MKLISHTFSLEELRMMVWKSTYDIGRYNGIGGISAAVGMAITSSVDELITTWREMIAEWWFDNNRDVSDVLVQLPNGTKKWVANDTNDGH